LIFLKIIIIYLFNLQTMGLTIAITQGTGLVQITKVLADTLSPQCMVWTLLQWHCSVRDSSIISNSCGKSFYAWEYLASHSSYDASGSKDWDGSARCSSCTGPKVKIQTRKLNLMP